MTHPYSNMVMWCGPLQLKIRFYDIELVQNSSIRFISDLKGRTDCVSEAENQLELQSVQDGRKNHRLWFLIRILQNEDQRRTLSTAVDEIARDGQLVAVTTRAAARGEPIGKEKRLPRKFPATGYWNEDCIQPNTPILFLL